MKLRHNDLQRLDQLPQHWTLTTLGSILPLTYGKALKKEARDESGKVPVYGSSGQVGVHATALTKAPVLIIGRKGSVGSVYRSTVPCWAIDTVYFCEERADVDAKYAEYLLKGLSLSRLDKSTAVPGLSRDDYNAVEVVVAPPDEQKRIVAEIEKQFSRLDEAVTNLNRVKANLKRYKAAVLKAAVEGRLVETEAKLAGREGRTYEAGEQVVGQLLKARRRQWRQRGKYKVPIAPQASDRRELPEGWIWATLDQLSVVVRGASPRPAGDPRYFGGSIPWITVGPLTADEQPFLRSVPERVTEAGRERSRYVEAETLLLTNSGATLGVPKITLIDGCINDGVAALLDVDYPLKLYLLYFLRLETEGLRRINQGAAQPNLNTTIIKSLIVPVPPLPEQRRIVAEVERRLSQIQELEDQTAAGVQRAGRLKSALFAQAFSGRAT